MADRSFLLQLLLILVLTMINAFFAGAEMAIVSVDKKKIKNANQKLKKNFFETDDDNHLSGYEVFYIFMICNVIGYCVEMVFCYLKHGYWESRQSLIYGPFGLAYGLGGVLLSYLLFKDTK